MAFALLSVSNKTGIVEFAKQLQLQGYGILSTGGTAKVLLASGIKVTKVSDYTGHPEVMNGRVKTLHPKIHGGILGRRSIHAEEAAQHTIDWVDIVVCNLYPFAQTISNPQVTTELALEQIDIGGPTMIRAAAKNHEDVLVLCDPSDYEEALQHKDKVDFRRRMAVKAFEHTASYDATIANWMSQRLLGKQTDFPANLTLNLQREQSLRYGENPHQQAAFYTEPGTTGPSLGQMKKYQGKELSFNNLADLDGALRAVLSFDTCACIIVKHMNPCGAAVHQNGPAAAFELALSSDPVSSFGGIIAFNRTLEADDVRAIRRARTFFEIIAAPGFSREALELLAPKSKIRVLEYPQSWLSSQAKFFDARRVMGGWLLQDWDKGELVEWKNASTQSPTDEQNACLQFAWKICQCVKSNAIVLAKAVDGGFVLNGVGAGQMSRLDSVQLAISKSTRPLAGSVLASDAFFPFDDGVKAALTAGVSCFIQPGGSIRDDQVIATVNEHNGTMVLSGRRHFRH